MNVWAEITRMLGEDKGLRELIVAPNAPLVSRRADGWHVLSDQVFSASDVAEGLSSASTHASGRRSGELGQAGCLCVGMRDIGRIHITYFTQRGSRVFRIVRVPFEVPTLDEVYCDPQQARELVQAIGARRYKTVLIYGTSQTINGQLTYALLDELSKTHHAVILIAEHMLSFLLAHGNSVVVQVEVPTDAPSLETAIQHALQLAADVTLLGDIAVTDELPSLPQLVNADTCTILSMVCDDPSILLHRLPAALRRSLAERDAGVLLGVRAGTEGKVQLELSPLRRPSAPA